MVANPVLELERTLAILALEKTLMSAEAAAGIGWEGATRPLYRHERDATVRFSDIHTLMNRATEEITGILSTLSDVVHNALLDAVDGVTDVADAIPAMMLLRSAQPREVIDAEIRAGRLIENVLAATFTDASNIVIQEARRQGVDGLYGYAPLEPERSEFRPGAMAAAMGPWNHALAAFQIALFDTKFLTPDEILEVSELASNRRVSAAGRKGRKFGSTIKIAPAEKRAGTRAPGEILDLVDQSIQRIQPRLKDTARQETHLAHGKGRARTAKKLKATLIYASEILDGATCERCKKVDGKQYKTITAARKDYPNGPFKSCLGGNRCRGMLIFIYDPVMPGN